MPSENTLTFQRPGQQVAFWIDPKRKVTALGGSDLGAGTLNGIELSRLTKLYEGDWKMRWADRDAGQYHPRMFMGDIFSRTPIAERCMSKTDLFAYHKATEHDDIYSADLRDIARTVMPTVETKHTYGARIRNLLIMACTEVEAQCKAILRANDYPKEKMNILDYALVSEPLRLPDYQVGIIRFPEYPPIQPFEAWETGELLPWYRAYNETKHDSEKHFKTATLEHAISAVCAVSILSVAQFGDAALHDTPTPFLELLNVPLWEAHEVTYAPPPDGSWIPVPFSFAARKPKKRA